MQSTYWMYQCPKWVREEQEPGGADLANNRDKPVLMSSVLAQPDVRCHIAYVHDSCFRALRQAVDG